MTSIPICFPGCVANVLIKEKLLQGGNGLTPIQKEDKIKLTVSSLKSVSVYLNIAPYLIVF